ncbi:MAG TPA: aspartyl protease family protein, partial [Phenylobacterium sp.]
MKLSALAFAVVAAQGLASSARAGEVACWYEQGVLIAPASVAGVAGDYILDTGSPATQLHETMAQGAGIAQTSLAGEVRLAGLTLPARPLAVANLDSRTWLFPTPIAGVIGADILGDYVVDVSFAPCRVSIRPAREAPP